MLEFVIDAGKPGSPTGRPWPRPTPCLAQFSAASAVQRVGAVFLAMRKPVPGGAAWAISRMVRAAACWAQSSDGAGRATYRNRSRNEAGRLIRADALPLRSSILRLMHCPSCWRSVCATSVL